MFVCVSVCVCVLESLSLSVSMLVNGASREEGVASCWCVYELCQATRDVAYAQFKHVLFDCSPVFCASDLLEVDCYSIQIFFSLVSRGLPCFVIL